LAQVALVLTRAATLAAALAAALAMHGCDFAGAPSPFGHLAGTNDAALEYAVEADPITGDTLDAAVAAMGVKARLAAGQIMADVDVTDDGHVRVVTDADLAGLHGRFLGDNSSTDVITFGGDAAHGTAGEICVSADAAVRIAGRGARRLSAELTLYVVHGWLHLSGYDDRDPASRRAIRGAESRAMRLLSRSASVPRFGLA